MTEQDYRTLRNRLMAQAGTIDKTTPEYRAICKRIEYINNKIWEAKQ